MAAGQVRARRTIWLALAVLVAIIGSPASLRAQQAGGLEQIAAKADPAVGRVIVAVDGGTSSGSGFVLGADPGAGGLLFLTNHHVIEGARKIIVGFAQDGSVYGYAAEVVAQSTQYDLAVLRLKPLGDVSGHEVSKLPVRAALARKGESVVALGFPGTADKLGINLENPDYFVSTLTNGTVSRTTLASWERKMPPDSQRFDIVQHTAAINPGNSGGPLLDMCAQVVGLNTAMPGRSPDGLQANDTYWASGAPIIAQFLRNTGIPFDAAQDCGATAGNAAPPASADGAGPQPGQTTPPPGTPPQAAPDAGSAQAPEGPTPRAGNGLSAWVISGAAILLVGMTIGLILLFAKPAKTTPARSADRSPETGGAVMTLTFGTGARHVISRSQLERGVRIGRGPEADISTSADTVSRIHAVLRLTGRKLTLTDLGSTNHTSVDGKRLAPNVPVAITSASRIMLGAESLSLSQGTGGGSADGRR